MEIIVKRHSESGRFKPHFNREMQKYYHCSSDYVSDMNRAGLEPYRPDKVKKTPMKSYQRSAWGQQMLEDIKSRKGRKPGDKFIKELEKKGLTQKRADDARRIANGGVL